jgi:hypothetical protein
MFLSIGKKRIEKIVDFVPFGVGNLINMGFGDMSPDGYVDDKANSIDGDIVKVMATVIEILKHFTGQYPLVKIYIEGSTKERTKMYDRIIRTYYPIFSKDFEIGCIKEFTDEIQVVPFDQYANNDCIAFLIKRIL